MPEIKHTFTAGRMNKDLDERLVPNGQYRDAMNIQVRTTDGDNDGEGDAGTVQNLQGNAQISGGSSYLTTGYDNRTTKIVGSVADEKNDVAYFLAAAPIPDGGVENLQVSDITPDSGTTNEVIWVDSIIEARTNGDTSVPVFVDKFAVTGTATDVFSGVTPPSGTTTPFTNFTVGSGNGSKYRVGMIIYAQEADGDHLLFTDTDETTPSIEGVRITKIVGDVIYLASRQTTNLSTATVFKFVHPERVLEFNYEKLITGINVLSNLLFWTDGNNEPKKINITRSERGTNIDGVTNDGKTHTQLFVNDPESGDLVNINTIEELDNGDVKKEHVTVIKKKPTTPLTLTMRETERLSEVSFSINESTSPFVNSNYTPNAPTAGEDEREIVFPDNIDVREGDVFNFVDDSGDIAVVYRGQVVVGGLDNFPTVKLLIIFSDENGTDSNVQFTAELEQSTPLFEDKFGRFGYRYKYEDNEYSAFSPWSELAFLPSQFNYTQSKGFNNGMENNLRYLSVNNFIPDDSIRPSNVKAVDILWKTTDDQNVYVVKSVKRKIDEEWNTLNQQDDNVNGALVITSDIIERALSSNQLIRTWDNVPRSAIAQETTANRIVYGNYLQGYDIDIPIGLKQSLNSSEITPVLTPFKSIKSIRDYKIGMVFGDKYGRETPVISNGYSAINNETVTGDIRIEKDRSSFKNSFSLLPNWEEVGGPLEWMDYVKYYVKETSSEYYNLVMDRWYDARDGNVWLSFPSSDRNKIDEETYLILKNEQGSQIPVTDVDARYKILAISNEAPEYVKLNERKFPKVVLSRKGVYLVDQDESYTGASPRGLFGRRKIFTSTGNWQIENIKRSDFKGTPKVRIVAEWYNSTSPDIGVTEPEATFTGPFVTVSQIIRPEGNNLKPGVALEREFTEDEVNAYSYFINTLNLGNEIDQDDVDNSGDVDYIHYYLEFADDVPQSKPEFDGRFFVKIEKNLTLEKTILNQSILDGAYISDASYDVAYISSQDNNPANNSPDNEGIFNNLTWDNLTAGGTFGGNTIASNSESTFTSSNLSNFGIDDGLSMSFWAQWDEYSKTDSGTRIFIDNVNTRDDEGFVFSVQPQANGELGVFGLGPANAILQLTSQESTGTINVQEQTLSISSELPIGLGQSNSVSSGFDYLTFSVIHDVDGEFPAETIPFKSKMTTEGTLFSFNGDPTSSVYRVINKVFQINAQYVNYGPINSTDIVISSKNFSGQSNVKKRQSIIVFFRKVDTTTNTTLPSGVNINTWDPRGALRHDGRSNLAINILEFKSTEEILDVAVATGSACFETEPKDSKDLDIYYEASRAIPLKLNKDNIQAFTGASNIIENASTISVNNRQLSNGIEDINLPLNFVSNNYGDKYIRVRYIVNDAPSNYTVDIVGNSANSIAINDIVSFVNKDGTTTRSKIIDHRSNVVQDGDVLTTSPSSRFENVNGVTAPNAADSNSGLVFISESISGFNVGMQSPIDNTFAGYEVTGTNIQPGTFVITTIFGSLFILSKPPISNNQTAVSDLKFMQVTGVFEIDSNVYKYSTDLGWFNCYSFGNGVESDRIRDDFNAPQIDNGCRVSSTFLEYGEERISSGLIHSGLFNSISSVNNLNEFNMGEKITKNLNPAYGSIQALKTRQNNIVVFTEDKILKVLANKDAVFNADGNPQLVATNRVLGDATPFAGDYGISKNPESLAADQYRMYFTDKQRGAVLRLSVDGLTPISNVGMKTYFREHLKLCDTIIGTFDVVNGEYNVTLNIKEVLQTTDEQPTTVSFNEGSKGWVSFKSFIPLTGVSVNGKYLTAKSNKIYEHYLDTDFNGTVVNRNTFYGASAVDSEVEVIFNDAPSSIKSFKAVNYEGSQSRVIQNLQDNNYYNLTNKNGWYVEAFNSDMQEGAVDEFIRKENKWFNKINGIQTTLSNLDTSEFSVQGIGFPDFAQYGTGAQNDATITIQDTGDTP